MTSLKPGGPVRRASRVSATSLPGLTYERAAWKSGHEIVAGVDEVGRGAWAGPLVAAALVLPREPAARSRLTRRLNRAGLTPRDSKLLKHDDRVSIVEVLRDLDIQFAVVEMASASIDWLGVGVANHRALCNAVEALGRVDYALIDAFAVEGLPCERNPVVGGDRLCMSIALASIVAKVHRDSIMVELDASYPGYGFATHKGYGTKAHAAALDRHGVTEHHRQSFRPVAERLERA